MGVIASKNQLATSKYSPLQVNDYLLSHVVHQLLIHKLNRLVITSYQIQTQVGKCGSSHVSSRQASFTQYG